MKFASWDLEISQPENMPDIDHGDKDLWAYGPFHITCAAVHLSDTGHVERWYGWDRDKAPSYAPYMTQEEATHFLMYLNKLHNDGYILTTWNGTAFDWRLLARETGLHELCVSLALQSFDPMLQVHGLKGYPVSLGATAAGFSLGTKDMDGGLAPTLWALGCYEKVLNYVEQDARLLGQIVQAILKARGIKWISKSGSFQFLRFPKLYRAGKIRTLPRPDTSWMDDAIPLERYYAWMEAI